MPLGILFWVIYVVFTLLGLYGTVRPPNGPAWFSVAYGWVAWVLIGLLGWKVFGPVISGG